MKTRFALKSLWALAAGGLLAASAQFAAAQVTAAQTVPVQSPDGQTATVVLSAGVPEILKLSAAHVGDDAIVAFIGSSGTVYNLSVNEIIYLKGQGLSDHVLAAMLDQHKQTAAVSVQVTTTALAPTQAAPPASTPASVYANIPGTEFAPSVAQPAATQAAPASTAYASQPAATYAYPSYSPYYASYPYYGGRYYGYGYMVIPRFPSALASVLVAGAAVDGMVAAVIAAADGVPVAGADFVAVASAEVSATAKDFPGCSQNQKGRAFERGLFLKISGARTQRRISSRSVTIPLAMANRVKPAMLWMLSLRMMRSRCVSTVRTPTPRLVAISLLLHPSAM